LNQIEGEGVAAAEYGPFGLIVLSQVVEHQVDPVAFLRSLRPLLATDGLAYIMVPGIHFIRHTYRDQIDIYLQNAHVWHFTATTMTALLPLCGFAVLACDESIECLARRCDDPPLVRIGEDHGRAVEREVRRQRHGAKFRSLARRGRASLAKFRSLARRGRASLGHRSS
jgi:hypothetical protein